MKFKIDENLPVEFALILQNAQHDAKTIYEQGLGGTDDNSLAKVCRQEERVLITLDMDFSDIKAYPPLDFPGLVVFRLETQDKWALLNALKRILPLFEKEPLKQRLWIVQENRLRIRGD